MKDSGFVHITGSFLIEDKKDLMVEIIKELEANGLLELKQIDLQNTKGITWKVKHPELEALKVRVKELEDTNSRLYRLITDETNRREAKRYL